MSSQEVAGDPTMKYNSKTTVHKPMGSWPATFEKTYKIFLRLSALQDSWYKASPI